MPKLNRDQILSLVRTMIDEKDHQISIDMELIKGNDYAPGVILRSEHLKLQQSNKLCLENLLREIDYQESREDE